MLPFRGVPFRPSARCDPPRVPTSVLTSRPTVNRTGGPTLERRFADHARARVPGRRSTFGTRDVGSSMSGGPSCGFGPVPAPAGAVLGLPSSRGLGLDVLAAHNTRRIPHVDPLPVGHAPGGWQSAPGSLAPQSTGSTVARPARDTSALRQRLNPPGDQRPRGGGPPSPCAGPRLLTAHAGQDAVARAWVCGSALQWPARPRSMSWPRGAEHTVPTTPCLRPIHSNLIACDPRASQVHRRCGLASATGRRARHVRGLDLADLQRDTNPQVISPCAH